MDPAQQTRPEMTLVAIPFVTKLKAVLSVTFIAKCVAILMLVVYGLTYQGYFIDFPQIRPVPKTHSISLYGDYFKSEIVRKNASFVIIVLSAIEKYQRRDAIRETWWKDCQKHQKVNMDTSFYIQFRNHSFLKSYRGRMNFFPKT